MKLHFFTLALSVGEFLGALCVLANDQSQGDSWRDCEIFLAPSSLPTGGWGVYAGRDFEKDEIVEITPLFIPLPHEAPVIRNSVIDDYIYGYLRWYEEARELENLAVVATGNVMWYNHHPTPNVHWTSYGREPTAEEPHIAQANGFVARRHIEAGEELFSTYGEEDGGKDWFENRRLELIEVPSYASRKNGTVYEEDRQQYCSKVYAGYGQPRWKDGVMASLFGVELPYKITMDRLAPADHPAAIVKQDVSGGTTLEMSPGLVVSKEKVAGTPVAALSFFWGDWHPEQQQLLRDLRDTGDVRVQHQDVSTDWVREDRFYGFPDVVVVPAAGNIALVERVGKTNEANCRLEIIASGSMKSHLDHGGGNGSAGIVLKLIALRDLKAGDRLKLDVPSNANPYENYLLAEELARCGQPIPEHRQNYLEMQQLRDEL